MSQKHNHFYYCDKCRAVLVFEEPPEKGTHIAAVKEERSCYGELKPIQILTVSVEDLPRNKPMTVEEYE